MTRNQMFNRLAAARVSVPDASYLTDDKVERGFEAWMTAGSPTDSVIHIEGSNEGERRWVEQPVEMEAA